MPRLLSKDDVRRILSKRFKDDTCTSLNAMPKPVHFKDIDKATTRIAKAIANQENIAIVGDYDVDGVVSSVILSSFFDDIGVQYTLKIPNRFTDGYGISPQIVKELDAAVIITVDNGISAVEAAASCLERGIDLIITDHHTVPKIAPNAFAIINPKQEDCDFPNCEICGAQVAWYLCAALKKKLHLEYDLSKFLDLLCIAIIADMMELRDMNRVMVQKGIKALNASKRPVFVAIKEYFSKSSLEGDDISFLIAPLINSAGRMEDAHLSYELLKSKNIEDAIEKLEYIVYLNNSRKEEEKSLFEESTLQIKDDENIVIVWGENWHEGVVGIVASRLSRRYKKPAIVFSVHDGRAKGSARSVGSVDILSLIATQDSLLLGFGGHRGAAGVALDVANLEQFKINMVELAAKISNKELEAGDELLGELALADIDFELLGILEEFEPYGQKNPKPSFMLTNAKVKVDRIIGRDKSHLKLILQKDNHSIESLFFNYDILAKKGDTIDILFSLSKNEYRGLVTPQLLIKEIVLR